MGQISFSRTLPHLQMSPQHRERTTETQRSAIEARTNAGQTVRQIAFVMQLPKSTIHNVLTRCHEPGRDLARVGLL